MTDDRPVHPLTFDDYLSEYYDDGAFEASVKHFEEAHDGPGWYWWYTDYPDEGCIGAYATRDEAMADLTEAGGVVRP